MKTLFMAGLVTEGDSCPLSSLPLTGLAGARLGRGPRRVDEVGVSQGGPSFTGALPISTPTTPTGGAFCSPRELSPALGCTGKPTALVLAYLLKIKTDKQGAEAASEEGCI